MSKNSAFKKPKIGKKQLSTAIAIALILSIAATSMTALQVAFGAEVHKISTTAIVWRGPTPVGINQAILLQGGIYPAPPYSIDIAFRITAPDGTIETITKTGNKHADAYFEYVPKQLGTWNLRVSWAGDANYTAASASTTWTVQTAQVPPQEIIKTFAYVSTSPKYAIGLGQTIYVVGFVTPPTEISGLIFYPDFEFIITKPNGAIDTIQKAPDSPATASFGYLCDQLGTYSVKLSWAGDKLHLGCSSEPWTWTVQTDSVNLPPQQPLPDYPWTHPVSAEYYEWYQITGAWPQYNYAADRSNFNPYSAGPNTAHVLWTVPVTLVGMLGQQGYSANYGHLASDIDYAAAYGRIYYRTTAGAGSTLHPVVVCLDQYTGQMLWKSDQPIDSGKPGAGSGLALEITTRIKIDPKLGEPVEGVVSLWILGGGGIWEIDPFDGATLYYNSSFPTGMYSDGAIYFTGFNGTSMKAQSGVVTKWDTRFKDVTWTAPISGITLIWEDIIFRGSQGTGGIPYGQQIWTWSATTGALIVNGSIINAYSSESAGRTCLAYGKWFFHCSTDLKVHAVDLYTGQEVWTSEPNEAPWGVFGSYVVAAGYGNYYQGTWDGYLSCYDAATGATKWRSFLGDNPNTAMGQNVPWGQPIIADGKVYIASSEHTYPTPIPRGNLLYCFDAFTGDLLWQVPFVFTRRGGGISSGMLFLQNEYDGCMYNFGKGESKTTVSAPTTAVPLGTSVLIQGTVTDQSAGAKDTPAVSDASQEIWMQYLYQNKPMPTNATGVSVHLVAIDSGGTVTDVGHAVSDSSGQYSIMWNPPAQDKYTIVANFDGTNSYYSSYAETSVGVTAAPPPTPTPQANIATTEQVAQTNTYLLGATIAIIIVVLAATIINLRKRK